MATHQVKIGVFIPNGAQALDVATVDILGSMSKEYLSELSNLPGQYLESAPAVSISYITSPTQGPEIPLTAGMVLKATHVYTDEAVAPGTLDIVVVPGPAPTTTFEQGTLQWLRSQFDTPGVDVLSVCTGMLICAAAGIADGKLASGPKDMQEALQDKYPKIKLVGDKYRWVQDGNFWSSGGVTNGNDLMVAYALASSKHWPTEVAKMGVHLTEIHDRGQLYPECETPLELAAILQLTNEPLRSVEEK